MHLYLHKVPYLQRPGQEVEELASDRPDSYKNKCLPKVANLLLCCQLFSRQNALSAAATWLRGNPRGTCLLEVRGCSARGEVPWRQQDRFWLKTGDSSVLTARCLSDDFEHGRPNNSIKSWFILDHLMYPFIILIILDMTRLWCWLLSIFHDQYLDSPVPQRPETVLSWPNSLSGVTG